MGSKQKNMEKETKDIIDYRKVIKDDLKTKFMAYPFISEDDIENELQMVDKRLELKREMIIINDSISTELLQNKPDEMHILKLARIGAYKLSRAMDINDTVEFKKELNLFVALTDHFAARPHANIINMDLVYKISDVDAGLDCTPLLNYMTADINLYNKVAEQVRKEDNEGIIDTLITVLEDKNVQLYALVRTATRNYFHDVSAKTVETMLEKVIKTYYGESMMLDHVHTVVKKEYELKMGKYVPDAKEINEEYIDEEINIPKRAISEHEYYGFYAHIADEIKTIDKQYHKFLVLKYDKLIDFDDVKKMMQLDDETAKKYYIDSLNYITELINNKKDVKTR